MEPRTNLQGLDPQSINVCSLRRQAKRESHIAVRRHLKITYLHHAEPVHMRPQRMGIAARDKRDTDLKPCTQVFFLRFIKSAQQPSAAVLAGNANRPINVAEEPAERPIFEPK